MGCIYLRKNLTNGKCYVGQAKDIKTRNNEWNNLNRPYAGKAINAARAKYGIDAFDFAILKECDDEELNQWEMYYIKELNTKTPYGYNMTDGGDSTYERTDETRKKISAVLKTSEKAKIAREQLADALRGKKRPAEVGVKISAVLKTSEKAKIAREQLADALRGRKQSQETIEKRVAKLRGKRRSEETRKKISNALKGKPKSQEAVAKMSAALRGKPNPKLADARRGKHYPKLSAAQRGKPKPKISVALKGRKQSPEHIAKKAAAQRGMKRSDETKARMSAAQKNNPKCSKPVKALDPITLEVVYEFPSVAEAERQGFDASAVSACCRNCYSTHKGNIYKGFIWRFAS